MIYLELELIKKNNQFIVLGYKVNPVIATKHMEVTAAEIRFVGNIRLFDDKIAGIDNILSSGEGN